MKFVDSAKITVASGAGGRGCVSFRREKFVPRGGPNGGDGGRGGDIIIATDERKRTLYHLRHKSHFQAKNGMPGQGSHKSGRKGDDLAVFVPPGTLIVHDDTGEIIKDMAPGDRITLVSGGMGGRGNARFKTATNRAPRMAQPGEPGETLTIRLELKLLADVGIIGFPNAGKSTLIAAISSAKPKIGDYPFTTLHPNLGVVTFSGAEPFVVADIPGLIEGAHTGAGLGHQFLRHVERTRMLIHLIDAAEVAVDDPLGRYRAINRELARYSAALARKLQVVVLNKLDLPEAQQGARIFAAAPGAPEAMRVSVATQSGLAALIERTVEALSRLK